MLPTALIAAALRGVDPAGWRIKEATRLGSTLHLKARIDLEHTDAYHLGRIDYLPCTEVLTACGQAGQLFLAIHESGAMPVGTPSPAYLMEYTVRFRSKHPPTDYPLEVRLIGTRRRGPMRLGSFAFRVADHIRGTFIACTLVTP